MVFIFVLVLVVAVIFLFVSLNRQSVRLSELEWKILKNIEPRLDRLEKTSGSDKKDPGQTIVESKVSVPAPPVREKEYTDISLAEFPPPVSPSAVETPSPIAQATIPPVEASRTREEWEALIGGKVLNRIGALAIVIAMAYFMKYAVDQNWIDETLRVFIGGIAGVGLWVWAFFLQKKDFQVFAQGIVGAGIGILYLSVFAAYNFYSLVSFEFAFVLMAVVTLCTLIQSLYYRSLAVGILGLLGGYLTPFILTGGETQTFGLFSYIFFLNAGLLAIVFKKEEWWPVELMSFAGVWVVFLSWYFELYTTDELGVSVLFLVLYWISFVALGIAGAPKEESSKIVRRSILLANAAAIFVMVFSILDPVYHAWMGAITLLFAGAYLGQSLWLMRTAEDDEAGRMQNGLLAIAFLAVATWIEFDGLDLVIAWSIEATAISFIGTWLGIRYMRAAAIVFFVLAAVTFLGTSGAIVYAPLGGFEPILNQRALTLLILAAGLFATAFLSSRDTEGKDRWIARLAYSSGSGVLFLLISIEVNDYFNLQTLSAGPSEEPYLMFSRPVWMSLFWSLLSVPFVLLGLWRRTQELIIAGFIILALAGSTIFLRGLMFDPPSMFEPVFNIRVLALAVVGIVFVMASRLTSHATIPNDWAPVVQKVTQYGSLLLLFSLLTGETRDIFEAQLFRIGQSSDVEVAYLTNMQQLSLSGVWLLYSLLMIGFGIWRSQRDVRIAAFALFGLTILKIFLYDLSYLETLYRIFSFIALGLVLLGVSYAYQRYKHVILGTSEDRPDEAAKD